MAGADLLPEPLSEAHCERLVVGLGNPGSEYLGTRHNVGFDVVDRLVAERQGSYGGLCRAEIAVVPWPPAAEAGTAGEGPVRTVALAKPQTYMNRSGFSVRCLVEEIGLSAAQVLVVYDEVALPLGELRLRPKGSPGGHRGMESVVYNLRSSDIARLRLGVGSPPEGEDLSEFVLTRFEASEQVAAQRMVERAAECVTCWIDEGHGEAMNRFNGAPPD
ncbi:MAG: aminoacyl-tRNA hydrolase [Acidobacteria bacterium]|nr:MAG: aminoacyl-tRNA hydrolase [Acidobacteriota bacterium]REK10427.1 MAG: aminoacyl-tRNA hydrolase [Acidobacteriota bacterium]